MSNTPRIERPKPYVINAWVDSDDMASWEAKETELDPSLPGIVFYDAYEAKPYIDQRKRGISELLDELERAHAALWEGNSLHEYRCKNGRCRVCSLIAKYRKEVSDKDIVKAEEEKG